MKWFYGQCVKCKKYKAVSVTSEGNTECEDCQKKSEVKK